MQSEKPKPLPNSSKRAGKCPGYDIDVDENGPHIIRCDHYCPHCDIHMTYDAFSFVNGKAMMMKDIILSI